MGGDIGELQERVPAQSYIEGQAPVELEVVLDESAVQVADQVVVQRRNLCECARFAVHEVHEIVARQAPAERPRAVGVEVLVEDALLARDIHAEVHLVAAVGPGPGVLQIVLVAAHAVERVYGVAEIAAHRKTEGIALG